MIAMAIAIILISMTDFSIMLDYQCYQFDNAAFDSVRNDDESRRIDGIAFIIYHGDLMSCA